MKFAYSIFLFCLLQGCASQEVSKHVEYEDPIKINPYLLETFYSEDLAVKLSAGTTTICSFKEKNIAENCSLVVCEENSKKISGLECQLHMSKDSWKYAKEQMRRLAPLPQHSTIDTKIDKAIKDYSLGNEKTLTVLCNDIHFMCLIDDKLYPTSKKLRKSLQDTPATYQRPTLLSNDKQRIKMTISYFEKKPR